MLRLPFCGVVLVTAFWSGLAAQATSPVAHRPARVPPAAEQIVAAVLPLPGELRDGATVLGYNADVKLVTLRAGNGDMICLASDPTADRFHVACYHRAMEPFMARGRALRGRGVKGSAVDSVRFAEVQAGTLKMPTQPAALYSLTGPAGSFDPATGAARGARPLYVIYIPFATEASTGIPATPARGVPWIMFPGTPKAHIMFVPSM